MMNEKWNSDLFFKISTHLKMLNFMWNIYKADVLNHSQAMELIYKHSL